MQKIKEKLMEELHDLEEKLKKAGGGKLSAGDLEYIHKLTDSIKNIDKIEILEQEGGYSEATDFMDGRMYGTSYDGGNSYARGRGRNARRDSMGRYSREGGYSEESMNYEGGPSYRGGRGGSGSRGGYSRADGKEYMIEKLEDMMEEVGTEKEREAIRHCISKIQNS